MADTGHNTLLDRPGIWAIAQHLDVMVRFEHENIAAAQLQADVGRHIAEVGGYAGRDPFGLEDKADRIDRIVRNGEGADGDIADGKVRPGTKILDSGKGAGVGFRFL